MDRIDEIVKLSEKLIRVNSNSNNPAALQQALQIVADYLPGFTIERFESNGVPSLLVYKESVRPAKFKLLLNGHLDVVQGSEEQFEPRVVDGKLYGRGAYDMKAATAAQIIAFKDMASQVEYPIGLQIVMDEEVGGFNGTGYQLKDAGVDTEFVVIGEAACNFEIVYASKGIIRMVAHASGKNAHGAYPWKGENAVIKINSFLNKVLELYPTPLEEVWDTTINPAFIQTENRAFNKVPDQCELSLDIRYIPGESEKVIETMQMLASEVGVDVEVVMQEPAYHTDIDSPYVAKLLNAAKEVLGNEVGKKRTHGGSDLRHFDLINANGVEFGPIGANHHGPDEYVEIESLGRYYDVLVEFMEGVR